MKKIVLSVASVLVAAGMFSCNQAQPMDPAAVQAKVDELAAKRIEEVTKTADLECQARMVTEVKAMAETMISEAKAANTPK
ncbi:MAG: hypothetical protein FGM54_06110 [Chitinophagaceae bacterium]|nr:hypothetical protein [Chitinophagaceae bacterium]